MKMRKLILSLTALLFIFASCSEEIDTSDRYVFKEYTVASYLEAHEEYSEYLALTKLVPVSGMSKSSVHQLLTARGNFTCFAPTNQAIQNYLQDLVRQELITEPSWESFTDTYKLDSIRKVIVHNSIIDGGNVTSQRYQTSDFPTGNNAEFALPNIADHKLTVIRDGENTYIDKDSALVDDKNCDIPLINGVIHQVHKVIAPKDESCAHYLQNIIDEQREGMLLFAKAVKACGLFDTLSVKRDEVYETLYLTNNIPNMENYMDKGGYDMTNIAGDPHAYAPEHRKIGFTLFFETDEFWRNEGIIPTDDDALEKLQDWIAGNGKFLAEGGYTKSTDYESPKNLLHQWVVYHILPMRLPANKLVYHCNEIGYSYSSPSVAARFTLPVYEWYAVHEGGRLIKIYESKESEGIFLNRFPEINNGINEDGHEKRCDPDKLGCKVLTGHELAMVNDYCCLYPIDQPLAYNEEVRENMSRERIRFDLFSLFPEAMTNGIRRADSSEGRWQHVYLPYTAYQYFANMWMMNDQTHFIHYNGYKANWANYCQDEDKAFGKFDIMFQLPPVPKRGTYELRYKVLATAARGVVQVYFGNNRNNLPVAGIPIDMTKGVVASFGEGATWADLTDDGRDEDDIIAIDHRLRNHGLMKSAHHEQDSQSARAKENCCRHILVRETLDPNETYYIRFKSVLADADRKELYLDYFEWCPKEVYDNPSQPEDIW